MLTTFRRLVPALLVISAIATLLWWLALWLWPTFRALFQPQGAPEWVLWSFLVPDVVLLVALPLWIAFHTNRSPKATWPLLCVYCGGVIYATLLTIALCVWSGSAWLGAIAMSLQSALVIMLTFVVRSQVNIED